MNALDSIADIPAETDKVNDRDDTNTVINDDETDKLTNVSLQNSTQETGTEFVTVEEAAESWNRKEDDILNDDETDEFPYISSHISTQETGTQFVTMEEVEESLSRKENGYSSTNDDDLSGSNDTGSISQLSDNSKTSKIDTSLNALKEKTNKLINSLKSVFGNSSVMNVNDDQMNSSIVSVVSDSGNPECRPNIGTSTPFSESKPLAARFLKKWKPKPSFIDENFCDIDEIDASDEESGYEKAMASLKEVLSDTSVDTASKLDSYSSMLDAFKEEDDKKYDQMISTITLENDTLEEGFENPTKEVDEFIEEVSEKNVALDLPPCLNDSVIELDGKDSTLVAREHLITVTDIDTNTTINDVPKTPHVVTINSSQSDNDDTIVQSTIPVETPVQVQPAEFDTSRNKKTTDVPKDTDLEILKIEGDEDIYINADDEDLLLASDDEAKPVKSENKKIPPQVPLLKDLEVFVSTDEDENKDNNDPKWDYLRYLGNGYERYLAVRSRWKNIQIPNPKKDLTCRCRNPVQSINAAYDYNILAENLDGNFNYDINHIDGNMNINGNSRKKLHSPENPYIYAKRARRDTCTVLFDRNIDLLAEDLRTSRQRIFNEQEEALQQLADNQHLEKYVTKQKGGTVADMQRLENKHKIETRNCVETFRRRIEELQEKARAQVTALQNASEEVRQFHEFYPNEDEKNGDSKSLVYLTDTEVQEILEVEEMLLSFHQFYNDYNSGFCD